MAERKNIIITPLIVVFVLATTAPALAAKIIYVDDDTAPPGDGTSWETAFTYLQDALIFASSGDEIRVAQGIYKPDQGADITPGDREATFQLINGVTLKGGYAGFDEKDPDARDIDLYETILSGDLDGNDVDVNEPSDLWDEPTRAENSYHVVTGNGTDETTFLDGFTVCRGNADGGSSWTDPNSRGAGMYNSSSRLRIFNCTFTENFADLYGGGMANQTSDLTVINCTFRANYAPCEGGGGMYNNESCPTLINCMFIENSAYDSGGEGTGGGIYNQKSKPNIIGCTFRENMASYDGGGIFDISSTSLITRCTFINNCAFSSTGRGGGISNSSSNLTLTNCTFADNSANTSGGAIYNGRKSNSILTNCTFSGNLASGWYSGARGGAIYSSFSYLIIKHCTFFANSASYGNALACDTWQTEPPSNIQLSMSILWDGGDEIRKNDNSVITINFSDVQGDWMGEGNIDADPCFVELGYRDTNGVWIDGDYHLLPNSPCIDAGDPNYMAEPNETDLDGRPRVLDGDNDGVPVVDMGAYEYRFAISAEVDIEPDTLNLTSKGKWITAFIWLAENYNIADIDPNSILLESEIEPERFWLSEDNQIAIAKFSREQVQSILNVGDIELKITGRLTDGTIFEGTDIIKVTDKAGKKTAK